MEEENSYHLEFKMIGFSGDAKFRAEEAVELAKEKRMSEADKKIREAEERLTSAHATQTDMIFRVVNGEKVDVSILLVHAQDYLTMATLAITHAKQMIELYKIIYSREKSIFPG